MPTISFFQKDLERFLGRAATPEQLESWLPLVKGELKERDAATGEWRVELQDSNRPDLWSVEGIARQMRIKVQGASLAYPFFQTSTPPTQRVLVGTGMEQVRPYIAACAAVGSPVTEEDLAQLIQTQEKLADGYGHKRKTVSVGLYRLPRIQFPVTYGLVKPTEARFTPMGFSEPLTLQDILTVHPKGIEYGAILANQPLLPLLWDHEGQVLSFPPIINSQDIGQVQAGDSEIFVEVTGTDARMVLLTLNIFAVNFADRGAVIHPVDIQYPYATDWGTLVKTPCDINEIQNIPLKAIESALGLALDADQVQHALQSYGYHVTTTQSTIAVQLPCYRNDLMHPVDVAEDVAISRGYNSFEPVMPTHFTVGSLSTLERMSDHLRDHMIGQGFQEIFSNILMSHEDLVERMNLTPPPPTAGNPAPSSPPNPSGGKPAPSFPPNPSGGNPAPFSPSLPSPPSFSWPPRESSPVLTRQPGTPPPPNPSAGNPVPSFPPNPSAGKPAPFTSQSGNPPSPPSFPSPSPPSFSWPPRESSPVLTRQPGTPPFHQPSQVVEIDNVMSQSFSCLRSWIVPSLLRVETASPRVFYPHRLFEVGEVALPDVSHALGSRTIMRLGSLIAHPHANFSEMHTCLDTLMFYLMQDYTLEPVSHGSFIEGRAGKILHNGHPIGLIGELHPAVLENWHITMPVSIFELDIDPLSPSGGKPAPVRRETRPM